MAYVKDIKTPVSPSTCPAPGDAARPWRPAEAAPWAGMLGFGRPRGVCSCGADAGRRRVGGAWSRSGSGARSVVDRASGAPGCAGSTLPQDSDLVGMQRALRLRLQGLGGEGASEAACITRGAPPVPLPPAVHALRIFWRPNPHGEAEPAERGALTRGGGALRGTLAAVVGLVCAWLLCAADGLRPSNAQSIGAICGDGVPRRHASCSGMRLSGRVCRRLYRHRSSAVAGDPN
jgi:hypothetical protein